MPFQPGNKANPGGRPKEKAFADAVRLVVQQDDPKTGLKKLRRLAEKLYEEAMKGEGWAMCQIADRLDGKPAQESTVNINDMRVSEMSDDEIAVRIAELRERGIGALNGNGQTQVH